MPKQVIGYLELEAYFLVILGPIGFGLALAGLGLAPTMLLLIVGVATASRYAKLATFNSARTVSCCLFRVAFHQAPVASGLSLWPLDPLYSANFSSGLSQVLF